MLPGTRFDFMFKKCASENCFHHEGCVKGCPYVENPVHAIRGHKDDEMYTLY